MVKLREHRKKKERKEHANTNKNIDFFNNDKLNFRIIFERQWVVRDCLQYYR